MTEQISDQRVPYGHIYNDNHGMRSGDPPTSSYGPSMPQCQAYMNDDRNPSSIAMSHTPILPDIYPYGMSNLNYELPETVDSVRTGWQWTCQSAAVVSGLLAAVAAQLLVFFKPENNFDPNLHPRGGAKGFLLGSCYVALFLNISATISSFILIDSLGEIGFKASCRNIPTPPNGQKEETNENTLLMKYGANREWNWMLYHWLATFYSGILALIVAILTYVIMQESLAIKVIMGLLVGFTLGPITWFIIFRPVFHYD